MNIKSALRVVVMKGGKNQEGFHISSFSLPIPCIFDSDINLLVDSNQVCKLTRIGVNNPERTQRSRIALNTYALFLTVIRKTIVSSFILFASSRCSNLDRDQSHRTSASATASLTLLPITLTKWSRFLPVYYHNNSHVALSGAALVVPQRVSMCSRI